MKTMNSLISVPVLAASLTLTAATVEAKDGILLREKAGQSNYCHLHFPAMVEGTLSWERPVLKSPDSGDIIHFYGPCDYDPHGEAEVEKQKRDLEWRRNLE